MGLFDFFGGGGDSKPTLRPAGPEEQRALEQLGRRGEAGTALSEAQIASILSLLGPETEAQRQALQQIIGFLSGAPFESPTVESALRRQSGELQERLLRQLGPGGEVSTPGRAALAEFGTQSDVLREQARAQQLGPALQLLGLLGPQATSRAQVGLTDPSPGIVRQTGVQERLGELSSLSSIAAAAQGKGAGGADILSFLGGGAGGLGAALARILGSGAGATGLAGLFGAGGAGAVGAGTAGGISASLPLALAASDRRLKFDIVHIGTHPAGIPLYEYTIFGRRERGVMADEAILTHPRAVTVGPDGYLRVDYAALVKV